MPIGPASIPGLLDVYDQLTTGTEDLVGAASAIAPAAVRQVLCQAGGLASLGGGPLGPFQSPGSGNRMLSDLGGILQAACDVPPPLPTPPALPPSGGQCPGVPYSIFTEIVSGPNQGPPSLRGVRTGPLTYYPNAQGEVTTPAGIPLFGRVVCGTTPTGQSCLQLGSPSNDANDFWERQDGLPDECGNQDPFPPDPKPPIVQPPQSPNIPTVDPDGNPGPPIFFEPRVGPIFVGPGGDINIPVVVNVGGPNINIPVSIPVSVGLPDFAPTIQFGGSGGGTGTGGGDPEPSPPQGICCEPPPPDTITGPDEDPEDPPEDPPGDEKKIVGVIVTSEPNGGRRQESQYFNAKPSLLVPRIATVQFEVLIGQRVALSVETSVKAESQLVAAPTIGKVTRALVGWEEGWGGSIRYIREAKNATG